MNQLKDSVKAWDWVRAKFDFSSRCPDIKICQKYCKIFSNRCNLPLRHQLYCLGGIFFLVLTVIFTKDNCFARDFVTCANALTLPSSYMVKIFLSKQTGWNTGSLPWIFSRKNGPKWPKTRGDTIVSSPVPRGKARNSRVGRGREEIEEVKKDLEFLAVLDHAFGRISRVGSLWNSVMKEQLFFTRHLFFVNVVKLQFI